MCTCEIYLRLFLVYCHCRISRVFRFRTDRVKLQRKICMFLIPLNWITFITIHYNNAYKLCFSRMILFISQKDIIVSKLTTHIVVFYLKTIKLWVHLFMVF